MNVMLKGENILKAYKGQIVLNDLSISLASGEIYGLIGPSGSGKTTLIKVLLGLEKLTKGEVALFGRKPSISAFHNLGYMAQSDALYRGINM
jgi:ABC-2 type transport system ATP-binding protein